MERSSWSRRGLGLPEPGAPAWVLSGALLGLLGMAAAAYAGHTVFASLFAGLVLGEIVSVRRLRRETQRMRALLSALPDLVVHIDREGRIREVHAPPGTPLPLPAPELIGRRPSELGPPDVAAKMLDAIARANDSGEAQRIEYTVAYPSGPRTFEARYARVAPGELVLLRQDITARLNAEREQRALAAAVDQMQEAVVMADLELRVTHWSRGAEQLTGWAKAEAMGRQVGELVGVERSVAPFVSLLPQLLERGTLSLLEERGRRDGSRFVGATTVVLMRDAEGAPYQVLSVTRDATIERAELAALSQSESRFRTLADSAPVMIWVSGLDKACTWFNRPWLDFTGRTLEQERGDGWAQGVHPEDLPHCLETYVGSFERREPFQMEYRLRRHDGVHRWLLDQGTPQHDATGAFTGYIGSCIDITDSRTARERLREQEERLERVVSGSTDGFFDWDLDSGHVARSPRVAEMLGLRPLDLAPTVDAFLACVHPDDAAALGAALRAAAADPETLLLHEFRARAADGTYRWLLGRAKRATSRAGRAASLSGTVTDVTQRHRAEEQAAADLARNEQLVAQLRESLQHVKALSGLLPICMHCHRIRNDAGYWDRLEKYISERTDASFTHSLCPECCEEHYPELPPDPGPPKERT